MVIFIPGCCYIFSIFVLVEKVANESQKTPRDVVMMENFHHIFATLSRLKISCLEAEKKEAKQKYTDHLQSYVIYSLGQPLEKLNVSIFSFSIFFLVLNLYLHVSNTTDICFKFAHSLVQEDKEGWTEILKVLRHC